MSIVPAISQDHIMITSIFQMRNPGLVRLQCRQDPTIGRKIGMWPVRSDPSGVSFFPSGMPPTASIPTSSPQTMPACSKFPFVIEWDWTRLGHGQWWYPIPSSSWDLYSTQNACRCRWRVKLLNGGEDSRLVYCQSSENQNRPPPTISPQLLAQASSWF